MSNSKEYKNYTIEKEEYLELLHFCRQYNSKKLKANSCYELNAVSYDCSGGSNEPGHPTENRALLAESLKRDCELIEQAVKMVASPPVQQYLLKNVTNKNIPYERLGNVPMGRQQFYELRRKFFYTLKILKMG